MSELEKGVQTQLDNIQKKTGKSLEELGRIVVHSGLTKHSEIRSMLQEKLGLGYGDANSLVHFALKSDGTRAAEAKGASGDQILDEIYAGPKAGLRPIHDKLIKAINKFGEYETVPKKGYVSLRRKKQFAMIGPGTKNRLEVGLNMKGLAGTERLLAQPAGGMCQYKVFLSSAGDADAELIAWLKQAYEGAG